MTHQSASMQRQVSFVGGCSYSGSIMLDMILAHGECGFSCGEVKAAFTPYRRKHLAFDDHAGPAVDLSWSELIDRGPDHFYRAIFQADPGITRIIDSSKDPVWIRQRADALRAQGVTVKHVLIWKTPAEFFVSRQKRGRTLGWRRAWLNYHSLYFRMIRERWASICYETLVTNPQGLMRLCDYLAIPYFPEKLYYWRGRYQTLFGNTTAKVHLNDSWEKTSDEANGKDHRTVYYHRPPSDYLKLNHETRSAKVVEILARRERLLLAGETTSTEAIPDSLKCSRLYLAARQARRGIVTSWYKALQRFESGSASP